mmetsp:Transcript_14202/g.30856  ORF Transcript_14202/g.30856 Transcript_14202/m.30856 type:complete len:188 (-) Transcript_14202:216-779(-)|eukprot:CAMPEP_0172331298 /NCGR_PEP_ID=MMETSP1058-20130122/61857_1 /TAXON_ID=83371 /ORGANISM="Detonula confervacea, Strain CCMP 353" /LENGTH=187 /DNA_ID=CAMNT_0013048563 /DNA_START=49 /DNA_END=612 /DNA_ORIENTATION=+
MATPPSKRAIVAGILSIMAISTEAWLPSSHHRTVIRNTRVQQRGPIINNNIHVESTDTMSPQSHASTTQLSLFKYIDKDPESTPPIIELDAEQDQALRDSWPAMEEAYGIDWFQQSEPWEEMKVQYPSLQQYTNGELERAFVAQKPTVVELITKTPLGPFLAVNGIFWLGGFSWCDTPFHIADACLP